MHANWKRLGSQRHGLQQERFARLERKLFEKRSFRAYQNVSVSQVAGTGSPPS